MTFKKYLSDAQRLTTYKEMRRMGKVMYASAIGSIIGTLDCCLNNSEKNGPPLVVKLRGGLQTFVRTVTWKYIAMKADGSNTIADIKKYIQESARVPMDRQRLVLYGKRLDDDRCLADYNVREGSTLHLVILR
nr:putative polyubiquitin [Tanacetum cinerariifolium]